MLLETQAPMNTRSLPLQRRHLSSKRIRRRAFTLTEVVVAMLLMTAVLSATWSLLNTFRDRFERSQARTERSQLIRAVQQTLENDLASGLVVRGRRPDRNRATARGLMRGPAGGDTASADGPASGDNRLSASGLEDAANAGGENAAPVGAGESAGDRPPAPFSNEDAGSPRDADSPVRREEDMAGMEDPSRDTRQLSMTFQAETDEVSQGEWLANEVRFLGTGSALVCDILTPAEDLAPPAWNADPFAPSSLPGDGAAPGSLGDSGLSGIANDRDAFRGGSPEEFADIPEHSRRIVYLFTDPEAALRTGRAPGLLRCELTNRHLAMIRTLAPDRADLYALVQPLTGVQQTLKDAMGGEGAGGMAEPGMGGLEGISFAQNPSSPGLASSGSMGLVMEPPKIDYVPEVKAFRLRYYDGQGWRERWDSRQEQELPVAVEMRFLFEVPRPRGEASSAGANAEAGPEGTSEGNWSAEMGQAWMAGGALDANPDDRLRSAQTVPIEDHRYVILLASPPKLRQSFGGPGMESRGDDAPDRFSPDSGVGYGGFGAGRGPGEVQP
jgi:type II secretory pathway pseudopilin PulG